jgi:hypothetical protein
LNLLQEFMDYCDGVGFYLDKGMQLAYWKQKHKELVRHDTVCKLRADNHFVVRAHLSILLRFGASWTMTPMVSPISPFAYILSSKTQGPRNAISVTLATSRPRNRAGSLSKKLIRSMLCTWTFANIMHPSASSNKCLDPWRCHGEVFNPSLPLNV